MTVQQGTCEWKSCVFPPAWTALFELPVSPKEIPHQRRPCINYAIYHALGTACMRYSSRPRTRSCDSMSDNSSRARSSPALPLLGLFEWSLSTRRSAASTRSRARSRSIKVYWRGSGRVRFFRGDARAPNGRRMPFRLTPVDFFVTISARTEINRAEGDRQIKLDGDEDRPETCALRATSCLS